MKRLNQLAALAALTVTLATGCKTPSGGGGQALDCDKARQTYALYQASLEVREPSEDEVKAARIAGLFLAAQCGWQAPFEIKNVRRDSSGKIVAEAKSKGMPQDRNGVLILIPPHE